MMAGLQTKTYIFTDNAMFMASPFNPYLVSGSAKRNPSRMTQPQEGL